MATDNTELIAKARRLTYYEPLWGELADALESATKPVTVSTVEELDALPRLAMVLIRDRPWQKLGGKWPYYEWQAPDGGFSRSSEDLADVQSHSLPFTVLYNPEQSHG